METSQSAWGEKKPLERGPFLTSSSVRRETTKRSIPIDAAKFVIEANAVAVLVGRDHVHLVNDLSVLAVDIATTSKTVTDAVARLRKTLLNGERETTEDDLNDLSLEKQKVLARMADVFGISMRVESALEFVREDRLRAERVADIIAAMYNPQFAGTKAFDVGRMEDLFEGRQPNELHEPNLKYLNDIARATLPPRLRKGKDDDQQLRQSFYAASEGAVAAAVIERGGMYASYRGPERDGSSIIKNMRRLVETTIYNVLKAGDDEAAKGIHERFLLESRLDGVGFRDESDGKIAQVLCDPHTLDWGSTATNGDRPPQKLPLLIYENELRPVTPDEFKKAAITGSGGIDGAKAQVLLANLAPFAYYCEPRSGTLEKLLTMNGVSGEALKDWLTKVNKRLDHLRSNGDKPKKLDPIVPGASVDLLCAIVHKMACDILAP